MNEYNPESKISERINRGTIDLPNCNTRCKVVQIVCEDAYDDRIEVRCWLGHVLARSDSLEVAISKAREVQHND